MIHVQKIRVTSGKIYNKYLKSTFVRNLQELEVIHNHHMKMFMDKKYPNGLPEDKRDLYNPFISVDSVYVTIPDNQFISYLVNELKYKRLPQRITDLVNKPKR